MANPLHELSLLIHRFGDEVKALADRAEHAFAKNAAPLAEEIGKEATSAAEAAVRTAVVDVVEGK